MSSPIKPSGKHPRGADRPRLFDDDDDIETRVAEKPEDELAQPTTPEGRSRMPSGSKKHQATRTGSAASGSGSGGSRSLPSLSDVSGPVMGLRRESKGRDDGQRMREVATREDEQADLRYSTVPAAEPPGHNPTMPDGSLPSMGGEVATKINPSSLLAGQVRPGSAGERPLAMSPIAIQTASRAAHGRMTRELPPGSIESEEDEPATLMPDGPPPARGFVPARAGTPSPEDEAAPVVLPPALRSRLGVAAGPDAGRELALEEIDLSVGRAADNHLILVDSAVSRHHLALRWDGARYHIRDLASASGTQVNGVALVGERRLFDGDTIDLGSTVIRLDLVSASRGASSSMISGASEGRRTGSRNVAPRSTASPPRGERSVPQPAPAATAPPSPARRTSGARPAVIAPRETYVPPEPVRAPSERGFEPLATMINSPLAAPPAPADLDRPRAPVWNPKTSELAGFAGLPIQDPLMTPSPLPSNVLDALESLEPRPPAPGLEALGISTRGPPRRSRWPLLALTGVLLLGGGVGIALALRGADDDKVKLPSDAASSSASIVTPGPIPTRMEPPDAATRRSVTPDAAPARPSRPDAAPQTASVRPRPDPDDDDDRDVRRPRPGTKPKPDTIRGGTSPAERTALGQYRAESFSQAVSTLRDAAEDAPTLQAEVLTATARDYDLVGRALALSPDRAAEAPGAMALLDDAIIADARSGKKVHASALRAVMGKIAPKAAMAHYAAQRYEQAKTACDTSDKQGLANDPQVQRVRNLLEAKAKELFAGGEKERARNPGQARIIWNRILRMVPRSSEIYGQASEALADLKSR